VTATIQNMKNLVMKITVTLIALIVIIGGIVKKGDIDGGLLLASAHEEMERVVKEAKGD
jgi:hypothetical protein